jgi:hypothetical protein
MRKKSPLSVTLLLLLFGLSAAKNYDMYDINDAADRLDVVALMLTAIYPPFSYYFLYIPAGDFSIRFRSISSL